MQRRRGREDGEGHGTMEYHYIGEIRPGLRERVERLRYASLHELSSHAFSSLYLWRKHMGLTLYLAEDFFTVKCDVRGKNTWFFPCGSEAGKRAFVERHLGEEDFSLCYLREADQGFLERLFPGRFWIRPEEEASEYLYDRREYETISGGRFSNMRKQIRRLEREHSLKVERLCGENIGAARAILEGGLHIPEGMHSSMLRITDVAADALTNRRELGIDGILVFVDQLAQSFALGFPLTGDTVDGCIECSNTAVHGLSYFTKREFFLSCGDQYRYMNAEEDLGIPGLRMAKRHMAPVRLNMVWKAGSTGS